LSSLLLLSLILRLNYHYSYEGDLKEAITRKKKSLSLSLIYFASHTFPESSSGDLKEAITRKKKSSECWPEEEAMRIFVQVRVRVRASLFRLGIVLELGIKMGKRVKD
jgi:hypothetical protein